jgi:GTPase SAR1 family protein
MSCKVVFMGNARTGKTNALNQYLVTMTNPKGYRPTTTWDDHRIMGDTIIDTPGLDKFRGPIGPHVADADVVILFLGGNGFTPKKFIDDILAANPFAIVYRVTNPSAGDISGIIRHAKVLLSARK